MNMMSPQIIFCAECGAANSMQATSCFACSHALTTSSPSPSPPFIPAQPAAVSTSTSTVALTIGSLLNSRYAIIDEIGQGGFGTVYKARDTRRKNRLVAIKEINLHALKPREIIEATDSYN